MSKSIITICPPKSQIHKGSRILAGLTRRLLVHVHLLAGLHGLRQEALRVLQALQRAATRLLRLLLFGDLGSLVLDLARTGEGAVDLTHDDGSERNCMSFSRGDERKEGR